MLGQAALKNQLNSYGFYSSLAFELVFLIVGGSWLGSKIDKWLSTEPWFLLTGVIVGSALGFYNLFHQINRRDENPD